MTARETMAQESAARVATVVRARPRRALLVCWPAAIAVVAVSVAVGTGLRGPTGDGPGYFQPGDQAAMIGLGLVFGLGVLMFTRPRVEADSRGIRVRNVVGSYDLPWNVVRAVTFDHGSPWVTLDLHDDDVVAVMAVQAVDKEYAIEAARGLRALHRASLAADRTGGPTGRPTD